jgi:hypothetical protein
MLTRVHQKALVELYSFHAFASLSFLDTRASV